MRLTWRVTDWPALEAATRDLDPPFAVLDLTALERNAGDLVSRAAPLPIRLAAKSIRCRWVLDRILAGPGFAGIMSYSLREALWLQSLGYHDILVGYPSVDRGALRELAGSPAALAAITLMIDSAEHLSFLADVLPPTAGPVRLCLDVDASLRIGPVHLGVRRSPLRTGPDAAGLAARITATDNLRLVGVMFYDAQVAGLPDSSAAVRHVKRRSIDQLAVRRTEILAAVHAHADLEFVNGGGTGSLHLLGSADGLTELTAGSGLYGPTLFDGYDDFRPAPAMFFALGVSRRPAKHIVTAFGGGYIASGPAGRSRLPRPNRPAGLALLRSEGAGEVQTPVRGRTAGRLALGDRVWFRHAKAGELCERFDAVHVVGEADAAGGLLTVPTYRGEGRCFG